MFTYNVFFVVAALQLLNSISECYLPNYSRRANVKVNMVLNNKPDHAETNSPWPAEQQQDFGRVNVSILGEEIDLVTLRNMKPQGKQLRPKKLLVILGDDFEPAWMSYIKPVNVQVKNNATPVDTSLIREVNNINFTFEDKVGAVLEIQPEMKKMFQQWLIQMASCPMAFIWEDLGHLFWPRYIKRGICVDTHSCSWPSGMRCRSSGSKSLRLLRWVCSKGEIEIDTQKRKARNAKKRIRRRRNKKSKRRGGKKNKRKNRRRRKDIRSDRLYRIRRARRIIRKMTIVSNGHTCKWERHTYKISDKCKCSCK